MRRDEEYDTIAWITKYALTRGIYMARGWVSEGGYLYHPQRGTTIEVQVGPNDWHVTEGAARARAEEIRSRKLASLQKQVSRLNRIVWSEQTSEAREAFEQRRAG